MDFELENELRHHIPRGERILWSGKPKEGIVFRLADLFIIPFSICWFGFAIIWEYSVIKSGAYLFALFGLPFLAVGAYMTVGRFILDNIRRKSTAYAITNTQVIILVKLKYGAVNAIDIASLGDIIISEKKDGRGTLILGTPDPRNSHSNGLGLGQSSRAPAMLELVEEPRKAYDLLLRLKKENMAADTAATV